MNTIQITPKTILQTLSILSFTFLLTACGSSSPQSADLSSRGTGEVIPTKTMSYCNKAVGSTVSYKLMAQYTNGSYDPNWAHVRLYNTPAGFDNSSVVIQFFKGFAQSDSILSMGTGAISFALYDLQTGAYLNNGASYSSLKWDDVKNLISGATVQDFKNRVMLVLYLDDSAGQYTVLRAQTAAAAGGSAIDMIDALIPAFYASPADYAYKSNGSVRESVLRNMHPFKSVVGGDYAAMALQLCQ